MTYLELDYNEYFFIEFQVQKNEVGNEFLNFWPFMKDLVVKNLTQQFHGKLSILVVNRTTFNPKRFRKVSFEVIGVNFNL